MTIPFLKMHGLGNDFVVIDARTRPVPLTASHARAIGDRRRGVGFDQLILIEPPQDRAANIFMRILNPDGSEAGACGNATRCVASLVGKGLGRDELVIQTISGLLRCWLHADGTVTVDMGPARLDWQQIPVAEPCDTLHLPASAGPLSDGVGVNMGNPHAVHFVPDAEAVDLTLWGPQLERHPFFPDRANIEVVSVTGPASVRMRVWERGAGITDACGSGACAVGVAAIRRGLVQGRRVTVTLDGGVLDIEWRDDGHVLMTGPVATSFAGTLGPELLGETL
ncbi:diaminopimelate epimerase [Niveispirillum lacus]|uniref:Diaminopimelate epimerase n=1 Tax=Niveispirillum lacus TaxID=1981099 RepID=A0A255YTV1_9PROT|nr:diaminopimelate epimerase [Niveispirillum lacus]OYQ32611.1 diaminopimelate epimerase [Niveispirillum lacus]